MIYNNLAFVANWLNLRTFDSCLYFTNSMPSMGSIRLNN